jgi:hypothetical protein
MRNRRIMMQMAGLAPDPYQRIQQRAERKMTRYARELQEKEKLMAMILRRERGDEDMKPMPFAREPPK